jgi:hypothetical protein
MNCGRPVNASDLQRIACALGGRRLSTGGYLCRCPVLGHGRGRGDRHPSLLVQDGETALLVRCYSGCEPHAILNVLRGRGLLGPGRPGRLQCNDRARQPMVHNPIQRRSISGSRPQRPKGRSSRSCISIHAGLRCRSPHRCRAASVCISIVMPCRL